MGGLTSGGGKNYFGSVRVRVGCGAADAPCRSDRSGVQGIAHGKRHLTPPNLFWLLGTNVLLIQIEKFCHNK